MSYRPARILVIEDCFQDVMLLRKVFSESKIDAEIYSSSTGDEGLRTLAEHFEDGTKRLDLILLDINMPGMNGIEVLGEIRANPVFQSTPVIMMTESRLESDVVAAVDGGATSFINKAADVSELYAVVRNIAEHWLPKRSFVAA